MQKLCGHHLPRIFLFLKINLFILFLAALGLRCCARAFPSCGKRGYSLLRFACFSLQWLLLLQSMGSRPAGFSSCGTRAPELRLSSCGTQTSLFCGMCDLPGPGLGPMSLAFAGSLLTTVPPGKSQNISFLMEEE